MKNSRTLIFSVAGVGRSEWLEVESNLCTNWNGVVVVFVLLVLAAESR